MITPIQTAFQHSRIAAFQRRHIPRQEQSAPPSNLTTYYTQRGIAMASLRHTSNNFKLQMWLSNRNILWVYLVRYTVHFYATTTYIRSVYQLTAYGYHHKMVLLSK